MSKKFKSPNPVGPYSMFKELSSGGWITSGPVSYTHLTLPTKQPV